MTKKQVKDLVIIIILFLWGSLAGAQNEKGGTGCAGK